MARMWKPEWKPERAIFRSPAFWMILVAAIVVAGLGVTAASSEPQAGGVLMAFGFCGVVLAAIIAGMVAIRTGRPKDEKLRESR